ncbi:MAG: tetratricopeptide repeat protein, partial [Anaerolinea sp.]|nr:tetratricopeptide repeat protein [Anaerolinea sp.]
MKRAVFLLVLWIGAALPAAAQTAQCPDAAALYNAGRYAEAVAAFECLIDQFPDDPDISRGVIPAYLMVGRYHDALVELDYLQTLIGEAFDREVDDWVTRLASSLEIRDQILRAFLFWWTGEDEQAQPIYDLLIDKPGIPGEFAQVFSISSAVWTGAMTGQQAIAATLALNTDNVQVFNFISNTLRDASGPADVEALTSAALQRFVDEPLLLFQRGRALNDLGRYNEAIQALERMRTVAPDRAGRFFHLELGEAYAGLGDIRAAQAAVTVAAERGAAETETTLILIQAHANAGLTDQAARLALDYVNVLRQNTIRLTPGTGVGTAHNIIMEEGAVFEFPFTVQAGGTYTFSATSVTRGDADPFIVLLDSKGTPIAFNDEAVLFDTIYDARIDRLTLAPGLYTLIVTHGQAITEGEIAVRIA